MALILYHSTSPSQKGAQVRGTRATNKSHSVTRVETSFNKSSNEFVVVSSPATKTLNSIIRGRKELSPLPERIYRGSKNKISTELDKSAKVTRTSKTAKTWNDAKVNSSLSKAETERFSPYVSKKEPEERKSKVLPDIKKSPIVGTRPSKSLLTMPETISSRSTRKEPETYTFVLGKGNNDKVIRKVLGKRYWWKEATAPNAQYDFCWYQTNKPINFSQLTLTKTSKRMANHFEFNKEIGTKNNLIRNLLTYCDKYSLNLFKITPVTFVLDLYDPCFTNDYQVFSNVFKSFGKNPDKTEEAKLPVEPQRSPVQSKGRAPIPRISQKHLTKLSNTYYTGCNLWLLKPTDYNRGRGINLFNKLSTLDHYLKCFQNGENDPSPPSAQKAGSSSPVKTTKASSANSLNLVKSHRFVVQKYIEKPMLIEGRKFDVRIWVLIDQEMNLYVFKEGYLRLSSEVFTLDEKQIEDKYVHLTNNAVQKYGKNYGKHESGNIISLNEMEQYLPKDSPKVTLTKIKDRINELIRISMDSVKSKLNACDRKYCFELFGYDFILDADYNVWIIEVNSNPSIDESNKLLNTLVPRMIDDAFKLTIDKVFSPNLKNYKSEDIFREGPSYPVPGYTDDENLWKHLTCLKESRK